MVPDTVRDQVAKTDPNTDPMSREPFLAYSNKQLDQGTLQPGQKSEGDFTFDNNIVSSLQVSTGKPSEINYRKDPMVAAYMTKHSTPQEMKNDFKFYKDHAISTSEPPEMQSPRQNQMSQITSSLQKLE